MKKIVSIMLVLLMAGSLAACGSKNAGETSATDPAAATEETEVGMANPWSDCTTLEEAEKIAGVSYHFRDVIGGGVYYAKEFRAMEGMLEITYLPETVTDPSETYTIRQAPLSEDDISGDETAYSSDFTVDDAGVCDARLRGTKDTLMVCSFDYEDSSYVIYPGTGSYNETFAIIAELTGVDPILYTDDPEEEDTDDTDADIEEEEDEEGAPIVEEGRLIDEAQIPMAEIAGKYSGINYGDLILSIYTETDNNYIGYFEVYNELGELELENELTEIMTNYYGTPDEDVTMTVYSDNGNYGIDLYVDGEHADYFVMVEPAQS